MVLSPRPMSQLTCAVIRSINNTLPASLNPIPNMADAEEDFSSLPLSDRFEHKVRP